MKLGFWDKLLRQHVTRLGRRTFYHPRLADYSANRQLGNMLSDQSPIAAEDDLEKANLVSSKVRWGVDADPLDLHAPALDIDFPAILIESSTPSHYHLYLDKLLTWDEYKKLLIVLAEVGIISPNYLKYSLDRRGTFLRLPGEKKQPNPPPF